VEERQQSHAFQTESTLVSFIEQNASTELRQNTYRSYSREGKRKLVRRKTLVSRGK
jgi:hypothetical protein